MNGGKQGSPDDGMFPHDPDTAESRLASCWYFLICCIVSVAVYLAVFSQVRLPYTIGIYQRMITAKVAHFKSSPSPRLLILAGSNARVSHSARIMETELGIPVTNGGLSAALSTAFVLESFEPHLSPGDIVYLPLEYEPLLAYDRNRHDDYMYMVGYDRALLHRLPATEQVRASFSYELNHLFAGIAECVISRYLDKNSTREVINPWGDQVGYGAKEAEQFKGKIASISSPVPPGLSALKSDPPMVHALEGFLVRCRKRGILVVGGLPTIFEDAVIDPSMIDGLRDIYERNGQIFLQMGNLSKYPRNCFYDSKYHLVDFMAEEHSRALSKALQPILTTHLEN